MEPLTSGTNNRWGKWSRLAGGLPAGFVDSAFASLGNFAAGLAAVNLLSDTDRGVYGVFFAAFIVGSTFPHNLVFLPSQVYAVSRAATEQLSHLGRTLLLGAVVALIGSLAILAAALATAHETTFEVTLALAITASLNLAASTGQDNTRRMLHIRGFHWSAASMSIVQFVVVTSVLLVMIAANVPVAWIPFGSLIVANTVSSAFGWTRAGGLGRWAQPPELNARVLFRSGRWLLVQALVPTGAQFVAAAVITALAGAAAMGYAESARVVAQPVLVVGTGLTAVLGPRIMGAAMRKDKGGADKMMARFVQLTVAAGGLYLLVAGWATPWNPMQWIVPSAYTVASLVAVTIVANVLFTALFLYPEEMMGARREVDLARIAMFASPLLVAVAFTASWTGAFARPLGMMALSGAQLFPYRSQHNRIYGGL